METEGASVGGDYSYGGSSSYGGLTESSAGGVMPVFAPAAAAPGHQLNRRMSSGRRFSRQGSRARNTAGKLLPPHLKQFAVGLIRHCDAGLLLSLLCHSLNSVGAVCGIWQAQPEGLAGLSNTGAAAADSQYSMSCLSPLVPSVLFRVGSHHAPHTANAHLAY